MEPSDVPETAGAAAVDTGPPGAAAVPDVTHRHRMSKCCWKNGAGRLAAARVPADLPRVKPGVSEAP